ncbi:MAG TPA: prolyl oligopeptidase family serine peptidase [Nocardioidaceae bacterium]|nr:prolyl oligopeptidase family serine peptidase [Nocardioidaceae bacterium]
MSDAETAPPQAARKPLIRDLHGVRRVDHFAWLRDTGAAETLDYLRAERRYYDAATRHLRPLAQTLFGEMTARLPRTETSAPWRRSRYTYQFRLAAGQEHPRLCRAANRLLPDLAAVAVGGDLFEPVLDPASITGAGGYFDLGVCLVSPDERWLAYSVDLVGDEVFALRFRDLESGGDLTTTVPRTYYSGAWSADSGTFFYTVPDEAHRPYEVWRHAVGAPPASDVRIFSEPDAQYEVDVRTTRSGSVVVITSANRCTSECWVVDAASPARDPICVRPRVRGVEYAVEHGGVDRDTLYLLTNEGAAEFQVRSVPLAAAGSARWAELMPADPARRPLSVDAFAQHLVVTERFDGHLQLRVVPLDGAGDPWVLAPSLAQGTICLDRNELFDSQNVTVREESYVEPPRWWEVRLATGERRLIKGPDTPNYDATSYVCDREVVTASDGTAIPVTVARRKDTPLDGRAPCLLYGYGAYEACFEPEFDLALPSLLDRGVVFAHAHVRGGGEGGRRWWLDGRLEHKQHTFADYLDVADAIAGGLVDGDRIATRGLSAGGLLQGAVFSQAPGRWRAVVAEVPFVDVVTTMLDPSIPLTANEWDEWGDPRRAADFAWLLAYSPYDNIPAAGGRPDLLVTGALHDARVMVSEPAKWVAALRASDPAWSERCLFRCELDEASHVGPSGRRAHLAYEAEVYAWILERLRPQDNPQAPAGGVGSSGPPEGS